ncbi:PadR family transcriptional regulator [Acidiphilium multivorum]|uniref:Transcriptional regulator, PadR family n=2 Tax=Acidocellaceae TaxID=3385905 RepID=A5G0N4_ACICJ|nr:transcriptional regulator, PadR family [Acidiphilium cryptum JF-5]UNC13792.1 PadR family transcriptional regulator [Acidiphilium multivorum]
MFGRHMGRHGLNEEMMRLAGRFGAGRRGFGGGRGWSDDDDGGFGRHGHGRRRMFEGGQLRLVLLKLISEQPRHGYELIRAIEERTGGAYAPSPGIVYPTLTLLAETGLASEQVTDGTRKLYEITTEGQAYLAEQADEVTLILARLDAVGNARGRLDAVPVRRAMHNLRNVLINRLQGGLDKERVHEVVALIDEAAGRIERL